MPGFDPASAPVASCGVLGFLEASNSYSFDYSRVGWRPPGGRPAWTCGRVRGRRRADCSRAGQARRTAVVRIQERRSGGLCAVPVSCASGMLRHSGNRIVGPIRMAD